MQENLARGLSVVSRAVSSRSTLPVLANVLLRTEDAGLKLTATNLEIGITSWVPGKIETEGSLTVPARLITDVVAGLPPGERVDLEVEGGTTLHIRAGRYQTHLRGIDADEFPVIPSAGERPTTRLKQRDLRRALTAAFSTPLDPEDIFELSRGLDEVMNSAKKSIEEPRSFSATITSSEAAAKRETRKRTVTAARTTVKKPGISRKDSMAPNCCASICRSLTMKLLKIAE
jgi:hypothetical protein